jgi:hypothetical protein
MVWLPLGQIGDGRGAWRHLHAEAGGRADWAASYRQVRPRRLGQGSSEFRRRGVTGVSGCESLIRGQAARAPYDLGVLGTLNKLSLPPAWDGFVPINEYRSYGVLFAKCDEHQFDSNNFINNYKVLKDTPDWRSTEEESDIDLLAKGDGLDGEDADISF